MDELKTIHESKSSNGTLNNLENAIADLGSYEGSVAEWLERCI